MLLHMLAMVGGWESVQGRKAVMDFLQELLKLG